MLTFIYRILCCWLFLPMVATATSYTVGSGQIATNLMEPVTILANFLGSASIVAGISFLVAGVIKYLEYRVNPYAAPISTVIFLLLMGALLVLLPMAYQYSEGGIPLSL